jgi:homoserine O-acetyltransferase
MTLATKFMTLEGRFKMHRGGYLESPTMAYETWGELNEAKDNAILIFTGLGSCFGSTGPASVNPETGERYGISFPTLSLEDVAESAYQVVRGLGIERLHTVVGCSMGGMSGLALCVKHPDAVGDRDSVLAA